MSSDNRISGRLFVLDGLRVAAMLGVVLTHSVIAYMPLSMPDLRWSVKDTSAHSAFDFIFIWVRGYTMPVFFIISGFWASEHLRKLGRKAYIHNRLKRILRPLIFGGIIILPLTYYVWAFGWMAMGECFLLEIFLWKFNDSIMRNLYGPVHLWFLVYLLIMLAAFISAPKRLKTGMSDLMRFGKIPFGFFGPFILSIPTALILGTDFGAMWNFRNTPLIEISKFMHYFWFFTVGAFFCVNKEDLFRIRKYSAYHLFLSCILFMLTQHYLRIAVETGRSSFLFGAVNAGFVWCFVYGLIGFSNTYLNRPIKWVRYLSDSAYWVYLTHFTLTGFLHLVLFYWDLPAGIKFLLVISLTFTICLWTYHRFVRYTFVGSNLHSPMRDSRGNRISDKPSIRFVIAFILLYVGAALSVAHIQSRIWKLQKERYTAVISTFYWTYFKRAPDIQGLEYWTGRAMDHMGLDRVEKEGFIRAAERDRARGKIY